MLSKNKKTNYTPLRVESGCAYTTLKKSKERQHTILTQHYIVSVFKYALDALLLPKNTNFFKLSEHQLSTLMFVHYLSLA